MLRTISALLSGLLNGLCFTKTSFPILAWVSLIPLLVLVRGKSGKSGFANGWLTGFTASLITLAWIVPTCRMGGVSLPISLLALTALSAYRGFFVGLFGSAAAGFPENRIYHPVACASVWVSLEYAITHIFTGFPWSLLGYSQWNQTALIQIARWTGVYGVSFLLVLVNAGLAQVWLRRREGVRSFAPSLAAVLLVLGAVWLEGTRALRQKTEASFPVAVLQGNIDQYRKWDAEFENSIRGTYERLALKAASSKPVLIVWPETALPGWYPTDPKNTDWIKKVAAQSKTENLVGAPLEEGAKHTNAAILLSGEGAFLGSYRKVHLVPFGEIVPLQNLLGKWIPVLNELGGFDAGRSHDPLPARLGPIGVSVCYEAIFPDLVRRLADHGAVALVNLTNDGWFLDTAAPLQHFHMNVFRAVENRRTLVRAANSGISGVIDPYGRVIAASELMREELVSAKIEPRSDKTFYTRHGDLFARLCVLASFVFLWMTRKEKIGS